MVLITGASSGIGKACAEAFARAGQDVLLVARREDRLKALADSLSASFSVQAVRAVLDVRDKKAVSAFAEEHAALLTNVSVLVNNAGLARGREPIQVGDLNDWDEMIDTNLKGLLYITRAVLPHFVAKKSGHVINMGSIASRWAYANGNVYSATKRAVSALNESMRLDLAGTGVRVTEIAPGMVKTDFSFVRFRDADRANAVYEGVGALLPEDVAEAVLWVSQRPAHVNVQELVLYPTAQASPQSIVRKS
jgi:3-hydroxy acid dehydrogenase / malonic semialdehyde reductase